MTERKKVEDDVILIGNKPLMVYVYSLERVADRHEKITLKARGNSVNPCASVAEMVSRERGFKIEEIKLGSDIFKKEGKEIHVTTIDIVLKKGNSTNSNKGI